ncbi:MAG: RHS repeat protein, partial [Synergistaceae bacterium]|nr:RHS repeat protein [Synergistaceae bacterium]
MVLRTKARFTAKKLLKSLFLLALIGLSGVAMASWRFVVVPPSVEAMRFNTIDQAHSFMVDYLTAQETGYGIYLSDSLVGPGAYGRYTSWVCFLRVTAGPLDDYDAVTCRSPDAAVYRLGKTMVPAEMDESPFLDLDAGEPGMSMCVGNPINLGTGNKFQAETDYQSGGADPLVFSRYYNSTDTTGPMGGWRHTYSQRVDYSPDDYGQNMVVVHRPQGQRQVFRLDGAIWSPVWTSEDKLTQSGNGWTYTLSNGVVEQFNSSGRLLRIEYPNGNQHVLSYNNGLLSSVEDGYGRTLTFEHAQGRISGLIDLAGEIIEYHYGGGHLQEVVYQDGASRGYLYDDPTYPGLLSGIEDERGNRFATWEYDSQGRAISSEHAGGADRTTITYNADGSVDVTNALGHVQTYTFTRRNGALTIDSIEGAPCAGFVGGTEFRTYNGSGFLTGITDLEGNKWTYRHNSRGLETYRIEGPGIALETEWHPEFSLPVKLTRPTSITEYTYDERLRVTSTTVTQRSPSQSRTWTYTYHPDVMGIPGRLASVDGPRDDVSDVTSFTYNLQGYLTATTNALGHTTQYQFHDDHGRATRIVDPNGVVRTMTYDLRGRLESTTGPEGTASYSYDDAGLLVALTKPNGSIETYQYDEAHRLLARADSNGNRHPFQLDALGNPVQEQFQDAASQTHWLALRDFNEMGWLLAVTDAYNNQTQLDYDRVQNLTGQVSPEGNFYSYEYVRYQRQTRITDPEGGIVRQSYANSGDLSEVADPRSRRTQYRYNGFGEVSEIRSPDTGNTYFTYDAAGNVATRPDALGQVTTYAYDALNRLTMVSSSVPGESAILYGYDSTSVANGIGRLTSVNDGNGVRTFGYTPVGYLAYEEWSINGKSFTTSYEYDGAGLLLKIHYPRGREVAYQRDAAGGVVSVTTRTGFTNRNVASQISRLPFGPVTSITRSNGLVETRDHDLNYRTTAITVPGVHQLTYAYTPDSHISSITDLLDSSLQQGLEYDRVGRLVEAAGLYGLLGYGYDANGNRTALTVDGQSQSYNIR